MSRFKDSKELTYCDKRNLQNYSNSLSETVDDWIIYNEEKDYTWIKNRLRHILEIMEKEEQ